MFRTCKYVYGVQRLVLWIACIAILSGLTSAAYARQDGETTAVPPTLRPTFESVPLSPVLVPATQTSASGSPSPVVMQLLVMTGNGYEPGYNAITTFLQEIGVPYQTVMVDNLTADSSGNRLDSLALTNSSGQGLYQGIILAIGNLNGLLSTADWTKLDNYSRQNQIRTISYFTYPDPRYGLTLSGSGGYYTPTDPLNVTLTSAATSIFPYIVPTATIPVQETPFNGWPGVYAYLASSTAAAGETTTPLLMANGYVVGVAHTAADGRQSLAFTFDNDVPLLHSTAFNYGLINWVTKGVFLGSRQIYLSTQLDDLFIGVALYNCPANEVGTGPCIDRATGTDMTALANWQTAKQSNPLFSAFRSGFPYVGIGTLASYLPPGFDDTLTPAVESLKSQFNFISHTYDHADWDTGNNGGPLTLQQVLTEISQNLVIAQNIGITVDTGSIVTPFISGLSNAAALDASVQSGISYVIADAGYATGQPASPGIGIVDPTNPSILEIPRRDTNLFDDVNVPTTGVPGSLVDEYNADYAATQGTFTYSQIIAGEAANELINMLHYEPYPVGFHTNNMNAYDGTHSMYSDMYDGVISQYESMFNLPVSTLTQTQIGQMLASRAQYNGSGVVGVYTPGGAVTLTTTNAATIQVTGACAQTACPTYGGQMQDSVELAAGGTATLSTVASAGVGISSISLNPTSVIGSGTSTGTITLTGAAGAGGVPVELSSNNTAAVVPADVTVQPNTTSANFTVNTSVVTSNQTAIISASYNGPAKTATLTIAPLPSLNSITLNPTSVTGGTSSTATVTLTGQAPTGGITVSLQSNNTSATVPVSVLVPYQSSSVTFTVTTTAVTSNGSAIITATYSGVSKTATLTLNAPPAPQLSSITLSPASVTSGNSSTATVTLTGQAPTGGITVSLQSNNPSATVPVSVLVPYQSSSATFTVNTTAVTTAGSAIITATYNSVNKTATLTLAVAPALSNISLSPTSLIGGSASIATVTLTKAATTAGITVQLSSGNTAATVPATVTIASGNTSTTFTVNTTAVATQSTASISATYGTVTKSATLTITPPALSAISLNPVSVVGGTPSTGTVTLTGPAPTSGITVTLASSSTSATPGSSVMVAAGNVTATFTVNTTAVTALTTATIKATYLTVSKTAPLSISPVGAASYSITFTPGATAGQGTVSWTAPAGHNPDDTINIAGDDTVSWWYVSQTLVGPGTSGSESITLPTAPGLYQVQYVAINAQIMASSADIPVNVTGFSVTASPTTVAEKGTLTGTWTAPSGRPQTWADTIGLYQVGTTNDAPIWYVYTMGATSGTFSTTAPGSAGQYEFRYVTDYPLTARSAAITVQ